MHWWHVKASGVLIYCFSQQRRDWLVTCAPAGLLNEERKGKGRKGRRVGARGQFAVSEIGKLKSIVGQHGLPGEQ